MGVVVRARPPRGPAVACLRQVSQRRVAKFNLRFSSPVEVKEQKTQRDRSKFFRDTQSLRKKARRISSFLLKRASAKRPLVDFE